MLQKLLFPFIFILTSLITGCEKGIPVKLFDSSSCVPIRNIHFRPASYTRKPICVKGLVTHVDKEETYLELKDKTGLVICNTTEFIRELPDIKNQKIQVLGKVVTGPMGIPYIMVQRLEKL